MFPFLNGVPCALRAICMEPTRCTNCSWPPWMSSLSSNSWLSAWFRLAHSFSSSIVGYESRNITIGHCLGYKFKHFKIVGTWKKKELVWFALAGMFVLLCVHVIISKAKLGFASVFEGWCMWAIRRNARAAEATLNTCHDARVPEECFPKTFRLGMAPRHGAPTGLPWSQHKQGLAQACAPTLKPNNLTKKPFPLSPHQKTLGGHTLGHRVPN